MCAVGWMPCSGLDEYDGVVWLPRLIQKARRAEEGRRSGSDMMNGYFYGNNDYIDEQVLQFLHVDDSVVSALVAQQLDDGEVARILTERSGRTSEERRTFSERLKRRLGNFALMEADERRMPPGPKRSALAFLYNGILMRLFNAQYRSAEKRRSSASP